MPFHFINVPKAGRHKNRVHQIDNQVHKTTAMQNEDLNPKFTQNPCTIAQAKVKGVKTHSALENIHSCTLKQVTEHTE